MGEPEDRVNGLEHGADDYLVKPFEPRELVLRIRNILQRRPSVAAPAVPAPADKAASRPAAPIHWRIDIFHGVCLLHMGFSSIGYAGGRHLRGNTENRACRSTNMLVRCNFCGHNSAQHFATIFVRPARKSAAARDASTRRRDRYCESA